MKYLWDTNTVIYFLQQQFSPVAERFIDEVISKESPIISAITEIELLCWKTDSEKDIEVLKNFINDVVIIELDQDIKLKTADIRKLYSIKLPDAIIAATALVHNLVLITRNTHDFKKIPILQIVDVYNL